MAPMAFGLTVTITDPVDSPPFLFISDGDVTITAESASIDMAVTKVEYFVNGVSIGDGTVATISTKTWSSGSAVPLAAGTFDLTAESTDNSTTVLSATVTVIVVDAAKPAITITSPAAGTFPLGTDFGVTFIASGVGGAVERVDGIELFVDGVSVGSIGFDDPIPGVGVPDGEPFDPPFEISWTPLVAATYDLTATVFDIDTATSTTSATVTIIISAGVVPDPPVITSPATGNVYFPNTTITIEATATDSDGTITQVEFFVNDVSIGTDTEAPFKIDFLLGSPDSYVLKVISTDNTGFTRTSADVTVTTVVGGGVSPVVAITAPVGGITAGATDTITATATDADGVIDQVEFFVDGVSVGISADTSSPFSITFTVPAPGSVEITAVGTDNAGNTDADTVTRTSSIGAVPDTPVIISPIDTDVFFPNTTITIEATATDSDGTISQVEFFVNGVSVGTDTSAPYTNDFLLGSPDAYVLTVVSTDNEGNPSATSATVTVTTVAGGGASPVVNITAPAGGITAGATDTITATATDADGTIAQVEFFVDGVSVGISADTSSPFSITFTVPAPGSVEITAVGTDNAGNTDADTVTRTSSIGAVPTVSITSPATSTLAPNTLLIIEADAFDSDGLIEQVEFFVNGQSIGADTTTPYSVLFNLPPPGTYDLTAVATDNDGNSVTSGTITITSLVGDAPDILITSPSDPFFTLPGSDLTIEALASDPDGLITQVEFFVNGVSIGIVSAEPYTIDFTLPTPPDLPSPPPLPEDFVITATATDNEGNTASDSITVTAATTGGASPTVVIDFPATGSFAEGVTITIAATGTDTDGTVAQIEFFIDGGSIGTDTTEPFTLDYVIEPVAGSPRDLTARATDNIGNVGVLSATVEITSIVNSAPIVAITAPADLSTHQVGTPITITATASDASGTVPEIVQVEFFVDGVSIGTATGGTVLPATPAAVTIDFTPLSVGDFDLTAVATDDDGTSTTSAVVTITAIIGSPPTAGITSPIVSGASFVSGTEITITADANDPDGLVTQVEFFANDVSIGTVADFPYNVTFTIPSPGDYVLTAVATDNDGNKTTSAPVTVISTIDVDDLPTVNLTFPSDGFQFISGVTIPINADAADDGSIAKVEFFVNGVKKGEDTSASGSPAVEFTIAPLFALPTPGIYRIVAVATDNAGTPNITISDPVIVTAVLGTAPTVSISEPDTGFVFFPNTTITIEADAADADGLVEQVEFLVNNVTVGVDTAAPFTADFLLGSVGTYVLTAIATDNDGNPTISSTVSVSTAADGGADPVVAITTPSAGNITQGTLVGITATATDDSGGLNGFVAQVEFFVDGISVGVDTTGVANVFSGSFTIGSPGTFVLTAVATDNAGNTTTSATVTIVSVVVNGVAPTVTLNLPADGTTETANTTITITATAGDDSGVTQVEFFVNGVSAGVDPTTAYSITHALGAPGFYQFTAVVTDNDGNTVTSNTNTIRALLGTPPTVNITSPVTSTLPPNTVLNIVAAADDADGTVEQVEFLVNGVSIGTDDTFPFTASFTLGSPGVYVLTAIATDNLGNPTISAPVTITSDLGAPPTIFISTPDNGDEFRLGTSITIVAEAFDLDGVIVDVEFFINGQSLFVDTDFPYSVPFIVPSPPGPYVITAVATDNAGNTTITDPATTITSVFIAGNEPTVTIISPAIPQGGLTLVSNTNISIVADAIDPDGLVTQVEFFVNGVSIGTAVTAPYTVTYLLGSPGSYDITAIATDDLGNVSAPDLITITSADVIGAAPSVEIISPANLSILVANTDIDIIANAFDSDGLIEQVEFFVNGVFVPSWLAGRLHPYGDRYRQLGEFQYLRPGNDNLGACYRTCASGQYHLASGWSGTGCQHGN